MRIIADLQVHSPYSRATSQNMNLRDLDRFARMKGLGIVGTGDFTHPDWRKEILRSLEEVDGSGLYQLKESASPILFMVTGEVNTTFSFQARSRRIHHCLLAPALESAESVSDRLVKFGDLASDGRPTLQVSAPELVDEVTEADDRCVIFPAHAWTPWFSLFGANSGFDAITECYQERTERIFALETGMSCYDEKTEILTNQGWKRVHEVSYEDDICTLDMKSETIEFQKPQGIFVYNYTGPMYELKTQRVDLLVTPNHKLLYRPCDFRSRKKFRLNEAKVLFGRSKILKKNGTWNGVNHDVFTIPEAKLRHGSQHYSGFRRVKDKQVPMVPWLKFFGFWIAKGWVTEGERGDYGIYVSNSRLELLNEIKRILETFGYNPYVERVRGSYTLRIRDAQLFQYLRQFSGADKKSVPTEVKALSKNLLKIFFEWYIKGDGHKYGRDKRGLSATTISVRLRDDLQEIALKLGRSAYYKLHRKKGTKTLSPYTGKAYALSEDSWCVYFVRKNEPAIVPSEVQRYDHTERWTTYNGLVSCVSVPNRVVYVRRNGVPVWSGNSDPPMNWRLSQLDKFCLLSNSDAHSAWPWRLGREANAFDLDNPTYDNLVSLIKGKDPRRFLFTIETSPAYGKYHWTGHRACQVSVSAEDARKLGDKCPKCGKGMTKGVEERVEELSDRPSGYVPKDAIGYRHLLPLSEIIGIVIREGNPASSKVWEMYNALIKRFGSEYSVMLDSPEAQLESVAGQELAQAILKVRRDEVFVEPGYDGVYGKMDFSKPLPRKNSVPAVGLEQYV